MKRKLFLSLTLIITVSGIALTQNRTITGIITFSGDGSVMPGVSISVENHPDIGTISGEDGKYSLDMPAESTTLTFALAGMKSRQIRIGQQRYIEVAMTASSEQDEEETVTALGIKRPTRTLGFSYQELKEDEFSGAREQNINNFLTAKVSGLQVSNTAGSTGGSVVMTIRGISSLTQNNQPLYVVDGIPVSNYSHSSGGVLGDIDYGDGAGDLNPNDIESVTVLKGPNATALYGSHGSNGVIMITTKSGTRNSGIGVEINSNFSIDGINQVPTFQNKYATGYEETNIYPDYTLEIPVGSGHFYENMPTGHRDSWGPPLDGRRTVINPFVMPGDTAVSLLTLLPQDPGNVRNFYDAGLKNSNTIAITSGNDKSTLRLSIGNESARGILPGHKISSQNVSLRANTRVSDFLSFDAKVNYIHGTGQQRPVLGAISSENLVYDLATMGRYVPLDFLKKYYDETGERGEWPGISNNPYYILNEIRNSDKKNRIISYVSSTFRMTSWLRLMGRVGADFNTMEAERTWPVGASGSDNRSGRIINNTSHSKDIIADVILSADKDISGSFKLSGNIGASLISQRRENSGIEGRDFKVADVYSIINARDIQKNSDSFGEKMHSIFFTAEAVYNGYLFLDITGRNDLLSPLYNKESNFYPSVASGFVFTDAIRSIPGSILSFGKVRASWAQSGNEYMPYPTQLVLSSLKNELTTSWEAGTDLGFFRNRLFLDVTYYNSISENLILLLSVPDGTGYDNGVITGGKMASKGLEITLNGAPVSTKRGFRWEITANYARNHSEVLELVPGTEVYTLAGDAYPNHVVAIIDHPYGDIMGYAYKGAPDGQLIVDQSGSYVRISEQSVLGNIMPDWIGGLNNTFSFKGLSLNILLDFVQGGELSSTTKYQMTSKGTGAWTTWGRRSRDTDDLGNQLPLVGVLSGVNEVTDADGNVTGYKENDIAADGQTLWANRAWKNIGEEFVLDASYISLREVILSYTFPQSLLQRTPIRGLTLSLIGRNLIYLEEHMQGMGISPESAPNTLAGYSGIEVMSLPSTRTYGVNVRVNF